MDMQHFSLDLIWANLIIYSLVVLENFTVATKDIVTSIVPRPARHRRDLACAAPLSCCQRTVGSAVDIAFNTNSLFQLLMQDR